jgi:transposase
MQGKKPGGNDASRRHYKLHVVPCRPGKPEHKGEVERGAAYLRNNALKVGASAL